MTPDNTAWKVSPGVRATYSEDGAVLLDIDKGICYSLNVVGSRIWVTIASSPGIHLEGIVNVLGTHFQAPREQLLTDTAEYLRNLVRIGLLHSHGAVVSPNATRGRK